MMLFSSSGFPISITSRFSSESLDMFSPPRLILDALSAGIEEVDPWFAQTTIPKEFCELISSETPSKTLSARPSGVSDGV